MARQDDSFQSGSGVVVVGVVVILASLLLAFLVILFFRYPIEPPYSRILEGLSIWTAQACGVVVPIGCIYLVVKTKNWWWLLTLLPVIAVLAFAFLLASADLPGLH